MSLAEMLTTVQKIAENGKGILAADESSKTIKKRFDTIDTECSEDKRREYREMLFTTDDIEDSIAGVILFEETLYQKSSNGDALGQVLNKRGIIPGIKVDKGLVDLPFTDGEKVTQGLDGLAERLADYYEAGARFAKWRAVFNITDVLPSEVAVQTNAHALARYAAFCQQQGLVPIVEPEVLMDGKHSMGRCREVTEYVLQTVFQHLNEQKVILEAMILKPSMVIPGSESANAAPEEVAKQTVEVLLRTVPAAVPTINFLSGGQTAVEATENLNAMNKLYPNAPWQLSFSYGRALQQPSLQTWHGDTAKIDAGKQEFHKRAKCNSAAVRGEYSEAMEAQ